MLVWNAELCGEGTHSQHGPETGQFLLHFGFHIHITSIAGTPKHWLNGTPSWRSFMTSSTLRCLIVIFSTHTDHLYLKALISWGTLSKIMSHTFSTVVDLRDGEPCFATLYENSSTPLPHGRQMRNQGREGRNTHLYFDSILGNPKGSTAFV